MYKLEFSRRRWIPDEDLNDQVFFLGFNTAFSLPASSTNSADCKGNRIYCTDDYQVGQAAGRFFNNLVCYRHVLRVFDVKDKSIRPHFASDLKAFFPAPVWVMYRPW